HSSQAHQLPQSQRRRSVDAARRAARAARHHSKRRGKGRVARRCLVRGNARITCLVEDILAGQSRGRSRQGSSSDRCGCKVARQAVSLLPRAEQSVEVLLTEGAEQDLASIYDYIAEFDCVANAEHVLERLL